MEVRRQMYCGSSVGAKGAATDGVSALPAARPISVLVADDVELIRDRIGDLVAADDRLRLLGKARDGVEAVAMIAARRPDVVVLDVFMPHMEADAVLKALGDRRGGPKVMLLTADPRPELYDAIMARPDALLYKSAIAEGRMCEEIVALWDGRSDSLGRKLLRNAELIAEERPELSPSQLVVLRCAAEDGTAKEIARKLGRKVKYVQNQLQAIHHELGVSSTTGAVARAYEVGLLPRPDRPGRKLP